MLQIKGLKVKLAEESQQILNGVNLQIKPGEVHLLQGPNGSGKSTLAAVLTGHPGFEVSDGTIKLDGKDLTQLSASERSLAGIFLANQYPLEVPGVNLSNFLRLAYNARRKNDLPVFKFRKLLRERASLIDYPEQLLDRNLNEGFSGGEKKKTEILQMAILEPKYAILDETDSGLDPKATQQVFAGINKLRETVLPDLALLIITHYEKVLDFIKPDFVHHMHNGQIQNG